MKVQTFLAIGGPCDGLEVTEQYAGDDYRRYNGATRHRYVYTKAQTATGKVITVCGRVKNTRTCVLIHKDILNAS